MVDARIPVSSRNPDIDELGKNKARLILLNKSDLADERQNEKWTQYFMDKGFCVVKANSKSGAGIRQVLPVIMEACKEKIERDKRRGIKNRPIRAMVVGIPNVGKSTFINSFAGKACTKTGNKPGVTKGKQWILSLERLGYIHKDDEGILKERYDVEESDDSVKMLEAIAVNRNCLQKGSELDYGKASNILLEEFRNGKIGRITLEQV